MVQLSRLASLLEMVFLDVTLISLGGYILTIYFDKSELLLGIEMLAILSTVMPLCMKKSQVFSMAVGDQQLPLPTMNERHYPRDLRMEHFATESSMSLFIFAYTFF